MQGIGAATLGMVDKFTGAHGTFPDAPTGLAVAAAGNTAANLTWVDASTGVYYVIYQNIADDFSAASMVGFALQDEQTGYVSGLIPGQQYYFWVETIDEDGQACLTPAGSVTITMGNLPTVDMTGEMHVFNQDVVENTRSFYIEEDNNT